ncbi:MAG: rhodanese-like domain-containing protein [Janthinobacterium lividum]
MGTDPSDVHAALTGGEPGFVVVDTRSEEAWRQGHVPGAVHLPTRQIARRAHEIDAALVVVAYCWGPGCNGATRAVIEFARLGYRVKEMWGGFEYWAREGFPVEAGGVVRACAVDPLTAPAAHPVSCGC